jgi:hypothetical protein
MVGCAILVSKEAQELAPHEAKHYKERYEHNLLNISLIFLIVNL